MAQISTAKKSKSKAKSKVSRSRKMKKMPKRSTKKAKKKTAKKAAAKKLKKKTTKSTTRTAKKPARSAVTKPALKPMSINTPQLNIGDYAPTFTLPDQNGNMISLSDYRGKNVVLYFYPKDDTPGCTKEACSFRDNLPTFEGANAVILGVSFDDHNSHQAFIGKYSLNFPLLSDTNKETAKAYGVYVQKNMYGNISWGIERSTFVIDGEGRIKAIFRRVSVDGHTQEVLNTLNQG